MTKLSYPVCYVTTFDNGYWCFVPDLGLFDMGDTMDELHMNLKEGVLYAVDSERQEGHLIPTSSPLTDLKIQREVQEIAGYPDTKEVHVRLFSVDYMLPDEKGGDGE